MALWPSQDTRLTVSTPPFPFTPFSPSTTRGSQVLPSVCGTVISLLQASTQLLQSCCCSPDSPTAAADVSRDAFRDSVPASAQRVCARARILYLCFAFVFPAACTASFAASSRNLR